ncbi:Cell division protein FtsQ [Streptomyces ambofaciens ATCC 23877]|uniref:Cell division protein FtsQ n=2 Tax=Streptomyces ambofaciens TaxID=1889 RepID=A0A0K2AQE2_STRA7|nr:cell division protein FtsQ [Streptomyces ambofaciens]AKZ55223.1 Cell division protein FtsQ [Streptomyces ambofaciens ATCC 23877]ANB05938.1 cell division protein FtsQ [Streptomyces ambofaciens]
MAGPTTAERGERQQESSGPPGARRFGPPRLRTIIILAVALVLLAGGTVWLLYGSNWTRVRSVSVTGTRVLTSAQVREAAEVPVGDPLVSVDTEAIEARLRRELPRIDEVEVERSWPHGIGLKVRERTPVLIVEKGRKFVEVDEEGVRFATVSRAPKGVPGLELKPARSGSAAASLRRFDEGRLVVEAVRVAGRLPGAVARDARVVKVRSYDDISVELSGGRTVAWGSGEQGARKAGALAALMKATPGARHFDVSVPTAPASSGS